MCNRVLILMATFTCPPSGGGTSKICVTQSISSEVYNEKQKIAHRQKSFKIQCKNKGKINTTNAHKNDFSLSWLGTGTSIKSGGIST